MRPHLFSIRQPGYSLAEVLVALGVALFCVVLAVRGVAAMQRNQVVASRADLLVNSLRLARLEAIQRNTRVSVCPASGARLCAGDDSGNWRGGWLVFIDGDRIGQLDGSDLVLRHQEHIAGDGQLLGSGDLASYVSYTSTGRAERAGGHPQSGRFTACAGEPDIGRRRITLSAGSGLVAVSRVPPASDCLA